MAYSGPSGREPPLQRVCFPPLLSASVLPAPPGQCSQLQTAEPREVSVGKAARPCVPAPGGLRESSLSPGQESGSGAADAWAPLLLPGLSLHCPRSPLILRFPIQVLNLSCCRIFTHSGQPSYSVLQMLILHWFPHWQWSCCGVFDCVVHGRLQLSLSWLATTQWTHFFQKMNNVKFPLSKLHAFVYMPLSCLKLINRFSGLDYTWGACKLWVQLFHWRPLLHSLQNCGEIVMNNINLFGGVVNLSQDWLSGQQSALGCRYGSRIQNSTC